MSAFQELTRELESSWSVDCYADVGVVIGVSGGADSVALTRALVELRTKQKRASGFLMIAHLNHGRRGEFSNGDEAFVRDLATRLNLESVIERATTSASDEASLRNMRMKFLIDTAKRSGDRYIALAHHRNDNVETLLHHLLRGTGPGGLAGIAPARVVADDFVMVRPLLKVSPETIRDALGELDQTWREDASNQDPTYTRNWIRHELIPLIQERFPKANEAIHRAIEGQRAMIDVIEHLAQRWLDEQGYPDKPSSTHVNDADSVCFKRDLHVQPGVVIHALQVVFRSRKWRCQAMTSSHWKQLAGAITQQELTRFVLPGGITVAADNLNYVCLIPPSGRESHDLD